jgi:hypothetical protein
MAQGKAEPRGLKMRHAVAAELPLELIDTAMFKLTGLNLNKQIVNARFQLYGALVQPQSLAQHLEPAEFARRFDCRPARASKLNIESVMPKPPPFSWLRLGRIYDLEVPRAAIVNAIDESDREIRRFDRTR